MKAISKLMLAEISKEQFLKINDISDIGTEILDGLDQAYRCHDAKLVDELIYLIFAFEIFDITNVDILNELLISDWHYKHEDIALLLEKISSLKSMEYLYNAIKLNLNYLSGDENYAFEIKCVRVIYYIGREKSRPYLEKLCRHENDVILEMAKRQISKLM